MYAGELQPQSEAFPVSNGMERNAKFIVGLCIFVLAAGAIGIYSYLQSREFLNGPQVAIIEPPDGSVFSEALVTISGSAQNVAHISLNGSPIFIDSAGLFSEKLLLLPGYNILTVSAEDRCGKKVEKALELVYKIQNTNPYENTNGEPIKDGMVSSTTSFTL